MPDQKPNTTFESVTIKAVILFDLLFISFLILSSRLATFLHEVLGHALVAVLSGGSVSAITVSLFGGGYTTAGTGSHHVFVRFLFALSGIILNLITGFIAIHLGKSTAGRNFLASLFLSVFAMVSLAGALAYLVLGLYYDFGDPTAWIINGYGWFYIMWVPFLLVSPFVSYMAAQLYISLQQRVFSSETFFKRLKITLVTLGISFVAYGILFFTTSQSLVSLNASDYAYKRAETRVLEIKKTELSERLLKENPELTDEQLRSILEKIPVVVEPDEVPVKFPMLPVLAGLLITGGLFGIGRKKTRISDGNVRLNQNVVFLFVLVSILVIIILSYTDGLIYTG